MNGTDSQAVAELPAHARHGRAHPSSTIKLRAATAPAANGRSEDVEEIIAELRELSRTATLDMMIRVGEIVFRRVFDGSMERVRHQGRKNASFRRLARHPNLPFSASALWRSVASYELLQRFPRILDNTHLGSAHLRAVLGLPNDIQEGLLSHAVKALWTSEQLQERAHHYRHLHASRRGRPALPKILKVVRRMQKLSAPVLIDKVPLSLDAGATARVHEVAVELQVWCQKLLTRLSQAGARRTVPQRQDG